MPTAVNKLWARLIMQAPRGTRRWRLSGPAQERRSAGRLLYPDGCVTMAPTDTAGLLLLMLGGWTDVEDGGGDSVGCAGRIRTGGQHPDGGWVRSSCRAVLRRDP